MENQILEIYKEIEKAKEIIVFTGAGVSTNSGIPDFRSKNGLYATVEKQYNLPYPEAIFDIEYFPKNPYPFFHLSKLLLSKDVKPTISHKFLAWLEEKGKKVFIITQNIDMLHTKAGSKNILECHGTYKKGHCLNCKKEFSLEEYKHFIFEESIPKCSCGGIIKPDIVFYGEMLPKEFYDFYENIPSEKLVLILGSSLTTEPAASLARNLARYNKSILINYTKSLYDKEFDYKIYGDLDNVFQDIWNLF